MRDSWSEQTKIVIPKRPFSEVKGVAGDDVVELENGSANTRAEDGTWFEVCSADGLVRIQEAYNACEQVGVGEQENAVRRAKGEVHRRSRRFTEDAWELAFEISWDTKGRVMARHPEKGWASNRR